MNLASFVNAVPLLGVFVFVTGLLALALHVTVYRRPPDTLDDAALFMRRMDVLELAALLDPIVPETLQRSLSDEEYRRELDLQIRLVREYLDRVDHNCRVIYRWAEAEYVRLATQKPAEHTQLVRLLVEILSVAAKLRKHLLVAHLKLWVWSVLRMDRWPTRLLPRIPSLRVLNGVNLLANYRRLTEIARTLAESGYGRGVLLESF